MAKVGDTKKCRNGHNAILKLIPESSATFSDPKKPEGQTIVTPAYHAWVCDCGEEAFTGNVEK